MRNQIFGVEHCLPAARMAHKIHSTRVGRLKQRHLAQRRATAKRLGVTQRQQLQAASVQSRMELGDARRPEEKKRRVARGLGFSLHADTAAHGNDREGLARLCRYASRGPVAEERLQRLPDGRYQYATKKGAVLVLTAHALVKRLVALVPPARVHLTSSHGVYAANARLRPVVLQPEPQSAAPAPSSVKEEEAPDKAKPRRAPRLDWATLLRIPRMPITDSAVKPIRHSTRSRSPAPA